MATMLSPVHLDYDTSIGHHYVYIAEILNDGKVVSIWQMCYPTLGKAQAFWAHQIEGEYTHTTEGWVGDLKRNLIVHMGGSQVRIRNLVLQVNV